MTESHQGLRESLGAYALGHLEGAEEDDMRAHLVCCRDCRDEMAYLQPAANALARLRPRPAGPVNLTRNSTDKAAAAPPSRLNRVRVLRRGAES